MYKLPSAKPVNVPESVVASTRTYVVLAVKFRPEAMLTSKVAVGLIVNVPGAVILSQAAAAVPEA